MRITLPPLPYAYNALEPYIDARTMELHHDKHHQTYVDNTNKVLAKYPDIKETEVIQMVQNLDNLPFSEKDKIMFKNNAGGHINHTLYWQVMDPKNQKDENLISEIIKTFGSVNEFKENLSQAALTHFGSGWGFLVRDQNNKLLIYSLPNQDSPYSKGHTPVICLDVWEHAYYMKYQNKRAEYIKNWWNTLKILG